MFKRIASVLALICSLGACVYSVDSAIENSMTTFDPRLVGTWVSKSDTAVVTSLKGSGYAIDWSNGDDKPMTFHGRTGRIGDRMLLEITPTFAGLKDDDWPFARLLLVLGVADNEVRTWEINPDPLRDSTARTGPAIPHIVRGNEIILTAPTAELAPALREHFRRSDALGEERLWRRVARPGGNSTTTGSPSEHGVLPESVSPAARSTPTWVKWGLVGAAAGAVALPLIAPLASDSPQRPARDAVAGAAIGFVVIGGSVALWQAICGPDSASRRAGLCGR